MNTKKQLGATFAAFAYVSLGISPVFAADTEIYVSSIPSAEQDSPSVMLLIDTSGSMGYDMYSEASSDIPEADRRYTHLKAAARRVLSTLPGDIKVGLSRYNKAVSGSNDAKGGRILYPARALDTPVGSNADGSQDLEVLLNTGLDDVNQFSATPTIVSNGTTLLLGGVNVVKTMTANTDAAIECRAHDKVSVWQNVSDTTRGLYLGQHPVAYSSGGSSYYCAESLGLRFAAPGVNASDVISARLVFTHYGSFDNTPSGAGRSSENQVDLIVSAQGSGATSGFSTTASTVKGRSYLSTPVVKSRIDAGEFVDDGSVHSVDVTSVVKAHISALGASSNLVLRVDGENGETGTSSGNRRIKRIYGYRDSVTKAPRLEILAASATSYTGVRFKEIMLPKGATINSASLEFTAAATVPGNSSFLVAMDKNEAPYLNSPAFDTTNHLASTRWSLTSPAEQTWSTSDWVQGQAYQADVTSLLQSRVSNTGYCGGEMAAVALRVRLSSGVPKLAYASEGDNSKAPKLRINYTPPSDDSCMQRTRIGAMAANTDDGRQQSGSQELDGTHMTLRSGYTTGLRFPNIAVPRGAEILSATLSVQAANDAGASNRSNITVKGAYRGNLPTFANGNKIGDQTPTTASVLWSPTAWVSGTRYNSPDIKSVIQEVVNHSEWTTGNALALLLVGDKSSDSASRIYARDSNASRAATLTVSYKSTDPRDGMITVRQSLIATIDELSFSGGTPLNESYYETALYMLGRNAAYGPYSLYPETRPAFESGTNQYDSPLGNAQCQANALIALTDGEPSSDSDAVTTAGATCTASFGCMKATAKHLYETGNASGVKVRTYTVGFGPVAKTGAGPELDAVAMAGGGEYFEATDVDTLTSAFQTIFATLTDSNASMATPGVAVNQLTRSEHLDQLYYGVFKPATTKRWIGNLKRYRLRSDREVVDVLGAPAVDPSTGFFRTEARSFWSSMVDGNEVAKGGASEQQRTPRNVYFGGGSLMINGGTVHPDLVSYGEDNIRWIAGIDVDDADGDGDTTDLRKDMGAPLHGQPTMLPYGSEYVAFVGTNDGLLHSVNAQDGSENWAWMPTDLAVNVDALRRNSAGISPIYGLDGSWTGLVQGSSRYLFGGMGDGGRNYYALNVTNKLEPALVWKITGGTGSYVRMANTWSQPVTTRIRHNGVVKDVLLIGGGYDPAYEDDQYITPSGQADLGNAVYIVDMKTGGVLWSASSSGGTKTVPEMRYSVPARLRPLDKDGDGLADHIYVGDLGGQIFRVDVNNKSDAPTLVSRVRLLAKLGSSESAGMVNARRFFEPPAAAYVTEVVGGKEIVFAAVTAGSGYRSRPLNKVVDERFFMVKDYDAARFDLTDDAKMTEAGVGKNGAADLAPTFGTASLANVSSAVTDAAVNTLLAGKKGWYIEMPRSGEKVLSASVIYQGEVYFNSYSPQRIDAASNCAPVAGATSAWRVSLKGGLPMVDYNNDGKLDRAAEDVATGISGDTILVILQGEDGKTAALTGRSSEEAQDLPPNLGRIMRTKWYDQ